MLGFVAASGPWVARIRGESFLLHFSLLSSYICFKILRYYVKVSRMVKHTLQCIIAASVN